jgi:DNA-binding CsgD family transcriptional regulator
MRNRIALIGLLVFQILGAGFFTYDMLTAVLGLPVAPMNWEFYELIEISASIGLIMGIVFGALLLRRSMRDTARMQDQLRAASGAFMELLQDRFVEWGLTPAERDVALFAIKGMSIQEIADLRDTSDGTVKAQTNAIYRKSGVKNRSQLLSLFIDDLMTGEFSMSGTGSANQSARPA